MKLKSLMKKPNFILLQSLSTWAGGGGSDSGGSVSRGGLPPPLGFPARLRDVYADPLQVRALQLAREGVIEPADVSARMPKESQYNERLWHSEPWVRQSLAAHDLLEPLEFKQTDDYQSPGLGLGLRGATPFVYLQRPPVSVFEAEMAQVLSYADLREDRAAEILSQIDDQWAHWSSVIPLRPDRAPRTLELLTAALQWAITLELRFKHALACPRPIECSPQVQPLITTPGHGSCPMGHAVQSFLVAGILRSLLNLTETSAMNVQLHRTAFRISMNRVVAGLHFPVDLVAGLLLGQALAGYATQQANFVKEPWEGHPVVFEIARYQALGPLGGLNVCANLMREFEYVSDALPHGVSTPAQVGGPSVWSKLWQAAKDEWLGVQA
jgi:hypothetical protein